MAINLNILSEYLPNICMKKAEHKYYMPISYVSIYQENLSVRHHTLYILESPRQFYEMKSIEQTSFLIIGRIEKEDLAKSPHEIICVDGSSDVLEVYQKVTEVLKRYQEWEETLNQILMAGEDITKMCEVSVPYFENTMVIQNRNFELLGVGESDAIKYPYAYREGESKYLALDIVLQGVPDAEVIFTRKDPFCYDYVPGYPSLLYNIFFSGKYVAQICVDAVNRPFLESDFSKIVILGKYIRTGLLHLQEDRKEQKSRFQRVFFGYLKNPNENRSKMLFSMQQSKWDRQDEYIICMLDVLETKKRNIGSSYLCDFISYRLPASISVSDKNNIVVLINVTRSETDKVTLSEEIEELQKTFGFTAGISDSFLDIMDAHLFLEQAKMAISYGSQFRNQKLYVYSDYRLPIILEYGVDVLPEKVRIPCQLRNLINESKKTSEVLLSTLKAYLYCDCNVNLTAGALNLSRNTLKNRLKRLRELLQTDFREPDEILYYKIILEAYII